VDEYLRRRVMPFTKFRIKTFSKAAALTGDVVAFTSNEISRLAKSFAENVGSAYRCSQTTEMPISWLRK
jgi:hypothetical protein